MFKNIKKSISWLLIISMLFTSHISSAFADSFDDAINGTQNQDQSKTEQIYFSSDDSNNDASLQDDLSADNNEKEKENIKLDNENTLNNQNDINNDTNDIDNENDDDTQQEEFSPDTYYNDDNSISSSDTDYEDEPEDDSGLVNFAPTSDPTATDSDAEETDNTDYEDEPEEDQGLVNFAPTSDPTATDSDADEIDDTNTENEEKEDDNQGLVNFAPTSDPTATDSEADNNQGLVNFAPTSDTISTDSEAFEDLFDDLLATDSEIKIKKDTDIYEDLSTVSNTTNVFGIGDHKHKECGVTGDCLHNTSFPGTNTAIPGATIHTKSVRYDPMEYVDDIGNGSKHNHLYLTSDINIYASQLFTREIWLCLNGYNINFSTYITEVNIHITNCSDEKVSNINLNDTHLRETVSIYGANKNIKVNLSGDADRGAYAAIDVRKVSSYYIYGVELHINVEIALAIRLNNNVKECTITLENVTLKDSDCDSAFFATSDSKSGELNLIDCTLDNNTFHNDTRFSTKYGVFHCQNDSKINFYGYNYIGNLDLSGANSDKLLSAPFYVNIAEGRTVFENINSDTDVFMPSTGFKISKDATLSFRENKTNQAYKLFAPVALFVEEGAVLEFVDNEFSENSGHSGIKIPEGNLIRGSLIISGNNNTSNAAVAEVLKIDKQLKIGAEDIYIAENKCQGVVDLSKLGIHWGTTEAFMTIENEKVMSMGSVIQAIDTEGTIIENWTDKKGYAEWENIFSYRKNDSNIGIIYDSSADSIKTGSITSSHTVKFRDSNNNPFADLPDRTVQDGASIGTVIPIMGNGEAFLGWFATRDITTGELSDPWAETDKVTEDITLYAKSGIKYNYTLCYDKNNSDVTGNMPNKTGLSSGQKVMLDNCVYKKANWVFKYWAENADGTGTRWGNGSSKFVYFPQAENEIKTIYAIWEYEHKHKICGQKGDCQHTTDVFPDTNNHAKIVYTALEDIADLNDINKTSYYYLKQDTTLGFNTLNEERYICLNGYNLTIECFVNAKLHITNCGESSKLINSNDHILSSLFEMYGVDHNIEFVDNCNNESIRFSSSNNNMYLYDVDLRCDIDSDKDVLRVYANETNNRLTLEKVNMTEWKSEGSFIDLYTGASIQVDFIDCKISKKRFDEYGSFIEHPSQTDDSSAIMHFRGSNIFEDMYLPSKPFITGVHDRICVEDGETIFKNISADAHSFIYGLQELKVSQDASLTFDRIIISRTGSYDTFNWFMPIPVNNQILGDLIIKNCIADVSSTHSGMIRVLELQSGFYGHSFNIGSGKIIITDNVDSNGKKMCALCPSGPTQDDPIINIEAGHKLNPSTMIDGIAFKSNQNKCGHIIDGWLSVSEDIEYFQDSFTAYNDSSHYSSNITGNGLIVDVENDNLVIKDGMRVKVVFKETDMVQDLQYGCKIKYCTPSSLAANEEFKNWYYRFPAFDPLLGRVRDFDEGWNFDKRLGYDSTDEVLFKDVKNAVKDGVFNLYPYIESYMLYNLHYDANGGTGHMDDRIDLKTGKYETLDDNLFTRAGYVFLGWCRRQDMANPSEWMNTQHWNDGDTEFAPSVSAGATFTIYAVWKQITWTLHFNANGGAQSTAPVDITGIPSGESRIIPNTKPTRNNYIFIGWATSSTTQVAYQAGNNYSYIVNPAQFNPIGSEPVKELYAVWQNITYQVTYHKNGGAGADMPKSNGKAGVDLSLSANAYTKKGYRFRGWDVVSNPTDPTNPKYPVTSDMKMNLTLTEQDSTDITVYAIWTQISFSPLYSLTADATDVTGLLPFGDSGYSNVPYTLADNSGGSNGSLAWAGKYLLGWATDSDAVNATYALGATITLDIPESEDGEDVIFYAIWGNVPYKIKLNNNGGVGDVIEIPAQSDVDVNLPANSFTRIGYKFLGWNTDATATKDNWKTIGEHYDNLAIVNRTVAAADVNSIYNLYAVWKRITYTLIYDANGGDTSAVPASVSNVPSAETIQLSSQRMLRTNYKFLGWASVSDAIAADYVPSSNFSYIVDADTYDPTAEDPIKNIYAVWKQITYKVIYDKNTGEGNDMPQSVGTSGASLTLSNNAYTKQGYRFLGWDESSTATAPTYSATNSMDMTKVLTEAQDDMTVKVYAIWKQISFTIIYNKNAGSNTVIGSTPSQMIGYSDVSLTLSNNQGNLIMPGKYLLGWDENSAATNATYPLGGTMTRTVSEANDGEEVILYAIWGNVPYRIKLYNNGGVGDFVEISAQSDVDANLPENTFTRVNYQFVGWSRDHNIDPTNFDTTIEGNYPVSGGVVNRTIDDSHANSEYILYAIWKQYTYTLKYDMNAGTDTSVSPSSLADITEVGSGDNIDITTIKPTRNNYSFLGWADTNTATVEQYQPGGYYKATVDSEGQTKIIYAIWAYYYPYTVSFDSNGGEGNMENIIATSAITSPLPSNEFTKDGFVFAGWSENQADSTAQYGSSIYKKFNNAGNVVNLYAVWKKAPSVSAGGGAGGMTGGNVPNSIINYVPTTHENARATGFYDVQHENVVDTYYRNQNGTNVEGWLRTYDAKWYLFEYDQTVDEKDRGKMIRGFRYVTDAWFFFNGNGQMATDFKEINNNTYYFETTKDRNEGKMATGWKKIGEKWYYFAFNGIMLKNQTTPDGYRVGQDGAWIDDNIQHNTAIKVIYHKQ